MWSRLSVKKGAEAADVTIRCYLLSGAIAEVLDEIYKEIDEVETPAETPQAHQNYIYQKISSDEREALKSSGFDIENDCCKSQTNPDKYIIRYFENQKSKINDTLNSVEKNFINKK